MSVSSERKERSIRLEGRRYILASSLLAEERLRVLKHEETFGVFDRFGEIFSEEDGEEGIFHEGMRFISYLDFSLGRFQPLLLNSTITRDNLLFTMDFTNADARDEEGQIIPRGSLHILRSLFLHNNSCLEKLKITNFAGRPVNLPLTYRFAADFRDIFEVRGHVRSRRGLLEAPKWQDRRLTLSYLGLDQVRRTTVITFQTSAPVSYDSRNDEVAISLDLGDEATDLLISYDFFATEAHSYTPTQNIEARFEEALRIRELAFNRSETRDCRIKTSNEQFNNWLDRSYADLHMLSSTTARGLYPYAGVPWFSTTFGRDGIITALQTLWFKPEIARGVLGFLADTQATEVSEIKDCEPGKILHEARRGEMAALGEIPFGLYYGAADSTPLFVVLAAEYYKVSGDREFLKSIWPNIQAALRWMDNYGDRDGDGFIEYSRMTRQGLVNQGWKDSHDSVFHRDGSMAPAPIALCEVQGYAYQAKQSASYLAAELGEHYLAQELMKQAEELKEKFHAAFWSDELGAFALALDGDKKRCEVRSSNIGHCLYSGIINEEYAGRVVDLLMSDRFFCGWGVRTIALGESRYNPMSYHNGSVWPHDTAIIAAGFSRYGLREGVNRILTGMFETSIYMDLNRLPELFCGFYKRPGLGPTLYPLSCAPQAWAAGSVYMLLQACLGLSIDGARKRVTFEFTTLPPYLEKLNIANLQVGTEAAVDIEVIRYPNNVGINIDRRQGNVSVAVVK